eukprot:TRINITY_DN64640_c0_g2_i1.p3 TRINITY_DN64640_c0_g2~~TRINITY_DN64640_c0_g2_i1.p3  ORF type:complete len:134 (-),score=21.99 TRINITY_DN64640_c0_g2_i1:77-478(-)
MVHQEAFAVGDEVILNPLPFAIVRYAAYLNQSFSISAVQQAEEGYVYDLKKGDVELQRVLGAHLQEPDIIVRARADCVKTMPLRDLLGSVHQFVVPLYQRKYCWTKAQWEGIWRDVTAKKAHSLGRIHSAYDV